MTQPFQFSNGQQAHSAEDLLELCQQFPDDGTNYLVREDLEKWLAYIGKEDIAQCARGARQTDQGDRQKLEDFLSKCHALSSPETKPVSESSEVETTPVATVSTPPTPSASPNAQKAKPSFFRTVAKLIINVLYRNKT